ncbi:SIR2 family protein [Pseudomonas qingdaonensis]|uniref:SIR2 family protein n=1 Tax=Pseudomonas qingdaonensis TaxID=2056231 RepID=UPI001FD53489|nr:SIR2 family protein [Pseudomonas qingdaonensis]
MSNESAPPAATSSEDAVAPPPPADKPVELDANRKGLQAYLAPGASDWAPLNEEAYIVLKGAPPPDPARIVSNRTALSDMLAAALQVPNLGFLAGSGTSLGAPGGPSMWDLWKRSMCTPGSGDPTEAAARVMDVVRYKEIINPNIEHFLSQCDAYLAFNKDVTVEGFVSEVKAVILDACSAFLRAPNAEISAYRQLLQKLARRRVRDPRLKVFTTNYDMCFETAASDLGMMAIDGFSYTRRRRFDGKHFSYDIVRREVEGHEFAEGVFQLLKLHGSVSWSREGKDIYEDAAPTPANACLIYPAKGKYQQAFLQPHLELLSRYLEFLRQPNSCLIVAGFGFNDDHLSEPIFSAIQSNPSLKLILCDFQCITHLHNRGHHGSSDYWGRFHDLAKRGLDIHFVSGSFSDLVSHIPHLRTASPAEQLANAVRRLGSQNA